MMSVLRNFLSFVMVIAASVLLAIPVGAQCAMCRASLAGSQNAFFIRNFNLGVLVLLVPPVAMFCSIFALLRRYNTREEHSGEKPEEEEGQNNPVL